MPVSKLLYFFLCALSPVAMILPPTVAAVVEKEKAGSDLRSGRISPPKNWDEETSRLFEGDPARRLQGVRPTRAVAVDANPASPSNNVRNIAWKQLIPAETVEDEIKSLYTDLGGPLMRIGAFKGGGHKNVEQQFAWVAAMFGILSLHSEAERWKEISTHAATHFSKASQIAQENNPQAFQVSKKNYEQLGQLIRGEKVDFESTVTLSWNKIVDRTHLMQRLEQGYDQRLKQWSTNQAEFEKNQSTLIHEAQIYAALAEIMSQPAYEFGDDDDYLAHCGQLKVHAQEVVTATRERNLAKVQQSLGELNKTCSRCHESYK
jgi:cytochrome c556